MGISGITGKETGSQKNMFTNFKKDFYAKLLTKKIPRITVPT